MKENVIIINCKIPDEAAQILNTLRKKPKYKRFRISYGALVKEDAGKLSLEDGFVAEDEEGRGWTGGLIGGLVGLLAGPVGGLVAGGVGALIGNSMDEEARKGAAKLLEKAGECLIDGETALLLIAEEQDEAALEEKLSDFQISITRLDAKEIADEIKYE